MARNLKALGLALVAAFAMSAVAASGALAQQGELTADGPVTLTMTQTGEELSNAWTAFGNTVICNGNTFTGHAVISQATTEADPGLKHSLLQNGVTTITMTPHFTDCTQPGTTHHVVIDSNGCDFVFHIDQTTGGEHTYGSTVDIVCPVGKRIETTVWNQATSIKLCEFTYKSQNGLSGIHLSHTTSPADDFVIEGALQNVHVEIRGLCEFGKTTTSTSGTQALDLTVKGHDADGDPTPVTITH